MREMKDSGVEWIGEIPKNWSTIKGKHVFSYHKDIAGQNAENFERLALTLNGVIKRSKEDNEGLQPTDFMGYQILKKDDLVFKLIDLQNIQTSRVGLSPYEGLVSPAYICLTCINILPKFAEKYFLSLWYRHIFNRLGDSGVRSSLNVLDLLNLPIALPEKKEQELIISFLDTKCAEIDSISEDIRKEIETLQEYRKSVITEAVTKGLNPNVEMKDSGVEWIGEIPVHWEVKKIKYSLKREEPKNPGNVPVLSLYREYGVVPKDSRDDNHNVTSLDTSNYKYVLPGDFVINKMKAWQGSVAVSEFEGIVSPAYFVYHFKDKNICKEYFHFLLRSCYKDEFRRISGGIREGQWDLPSEMFEVTSFLIPPYKEQQNIVSFLNTKCAEIDSIISDKQKQLDTLAEYRKSLIYEYVTGKKEVPTT